MYLLFCFAIKLMGRRGRQPLQSYEMISFALYLTTLSVDVGIDRYKNLFYKKISSTPTDFSRTLSKLSSAVPYKFPWRVENKIHTVQLGRNSAFCISHFAFSIVHQTTPCDSIVSATLIKPAMFAPATRLPGIPYSCAAREED